MVRSYTPDDLASGLRVLTRSGFIAVSGTLLRHPAGHEVSIDLTNAYPFNVKRIGDADFEYEFSVHGLIGELSDMGV